MMKDLEMNEMCFFYPGITEVYQTWKTQNLYLHDEFLYYGSVLLFQSLL